MLRNQDPSASVHIKLIGYHRASSQKIKTVRTPLHEIQLCIGVPLGFSAGTRIMGRLVFTDCTSQACKYLCDKEYPYLNITAEPVTGNANWEDSDLPQCMASTCAHAAWMKSRLWCMYEGIPELEKPWLVQLAIVQMFKKQLQILQSQWDLQLVAQSK